MDEVGFVTHMQKKGKPTDTTKSYVNRIKNFEKFLTENKNGTPLEDATVEDLEEFAEWCKKNDLSGYQHMWGIRAYYNYSSNEELEYACSFLMQKIKLEEFNLKDFMNVNKEYTKLLTKIGIKTPSQLLEKGHTKKDRAEIAKESDVPEEYVLELVKLSNLARVPGHMKKRARLYFESGLDTFDKIAAQDPEEMVHYLEEFIEKSGFKGSPPTLSDAASSVENSKRIPRIIEF